MKRFVRIWFVVVLSFVLSLSEVYSVNCNLAPFSENNYTEIENKMFSNGELLKSRIAGLQDKFLLQNFSKSVVMSSEDPIVKIAQVIVDSHTYMKKIYIPFHSKNTEEKQNMINELENVILVPIIKMLNKIDELYALRLIDPNGVRLKLGKYEDLIPSINCKGKTKAKVGFLPLKGDPIHWGHVGIILNLLSKGVDKVIIMQDNGSHEKPELLALPLREALFSEMLEALNPFVEQISFQKEIPDLFMADGEKVMFTIIKENINIIDQVEWVYSAGSDHANWAAKNGKPDTVQKLYVGKNLFQQEHQNAQISMSIDFTERPGATKTSSELDSLMGLANRQITITSDLLMDLDLSSTRVRKQGDFHIIPITSFIASAAMRLYAFDDKIDRNEQDEMISLVKTEVEGILQTEKNGKYLTVRSPEHRLSKLKVIMNTLSGYQLNLIDHFVMAQKSLNLNNFEPDVKSQIDSRLDSVRKIIFDASRLLYSKGRKRLFNITPTDAMELVANALHNDISVLRNVNASL